MSPTSYQAAPPRIVRKDYSTFCKPCKVPKRANSQILANQLTLQRLQRYIT